MSRSIKAQRKRQAAPDGKQFRILEPSCRRAPTRVKPEWLSHVNAGVLKVKLATALIGISSIHLLKTFIEIGTPGITEQTALWQVVVHLTFVASALLLAWTDRISSVTAVETRSKAH